MIRLGEEKQIQSHWREGRNGYIIELSSNVFTLPKFIGAQDVDFHLNMWQCCINWDRRPIYETKM